MTEKITKIVQELQDKNKGLISWDWIKGFSTGDGCFKHKEHIFQIGLSIKDNQVLDIIKRRLKLDNIESNLIEYSNINKRKKGFNSNDIALLRILRKKDYKSFLFKYNQSIKNKISWVIGFLEAEGSFVISLPFRNRIKPIPRLMVSVSSKKEENLIFVKNIIGGNISRKRDGFYCLNIRKTKDLIKIKSLFKKKYFFTKKKFDFFKWLMAFNLIYKNHRNIWTRGKYLKLCKIRDSMNLTGYIPSHPKNYKDFVWFKDYFKVNNIK